MNTEPKWLFGYCLLVAWLILAILFGVGHVEEKTSFGLDKVLIALTFISGSWSQWAFQTKGKDEKEDKEG